MIIIHAVKKLLNTSRILAALHIGKASEGQYLYSWYAALVPTGVAGKMLVMYVHEHSMITILCKGKTIKTTWPVLVERLGNLLRRWRVPEVFIHNEMRQMNDFIVSKTNSRSMLGVLNQLQEDLAWYIEQSEQSYDFFELDVWEDRLMDRLHAAGRKSWDYTSPVKFLREITGG